MFPRGNTLRPKSLLLLSWLAVVVGCGADSGGDSATDDDSIFGGMSTEEMQRQASQMTPAEAESLGIVDTMIRPQSPSNPADTTRRP